MEEKNIGEVAIEVKNLSKIYKLYDKPSDRFKEALRLTRRQYREHYALRDVNMSIRQGETVGIIGTNGSGKSTILKIITGVFHTVFAPICQITSAKCTFSFLKIAAPIRKSATVTPQKYRVPETSSKNQ